MSLPPAIVLGVDSPIGLAVVRQLGRHGVPVIGIGKTRHAVGGASRYVHKFVLRTPGLPLAEWLPERIAESGAAVLFAISEGDLLELAGMPEAIAGCRIATPRAGPLAVVLDKRLTLEAARSVGIAVPESWQPVPGEDFQRRAAALAYPVVVKWADPPALWARLDAAGLAFTKVERADDAPALLRILARYDALGEYPLVQTWCPGEGFGQMLLMDGGAARLRFQHRRVREYPASGGVSTLCEAVPLGEHPEQMTRSQALLAAIGWQGPAMVEYRHDPATGKCVLMEINGRFWGSLPLATLCGVDFAWEQYRAIVLGEAGEKQPAYPIRRARYLVPDTRRLAGILLGRVPGFSRAREAWDYAREFLNPRTGYYVGSLDDPLPLLTDLAGMVSRLRR